MKTPPIDPSNKPHQSHEPEKQVKESILSKLGNKVMGILKRTPPETNSLNTKDPDLISAMVDDGKFNLQQMTDLVNKIYLDPNVFHTKTEMSQVKQKLKLAIKQIKDPISFKKGEKYNANHTVRRLEKLINDRQAELSDDDTESPRSQPPQRPPPQHFEKSSDESFNTEEIKELNEMINQFSETSEDTSSTQERKLPQPPSFTEQVKKMNWDELNDLAGEIRNEEKATKGTVSRELRAKKIAVQKEIRSRQVKGPPKKPVPQPKAEQDLSKVRELAEELQNHNLFAETPQGLKELKQLVESQMEGGIEAKELLEGVLQKIDNTIAARKEYYKKVGPKTGRPLPPGPKGKFPKKPPPRPDRRK